MHVVGVLRKHILLCAVGEAFWQLHPIALQLQVPWHQVVNAAIGFRWYWGSRHSTR